MKGRAEGDAFALPFEADTFDLCFSYTVSEHIPTALFLAEQRRVLKRGGRVSVLSVRRKYGLDEDRRRLSGTREKALFDKLWKQAIGMDAAHPVGVYEMSEEDYPRVLEKAGFVSVNADFFTVLTYATDNAPVTEETALEQIEVNRLGSLLSVEKTLKINPDALTLGEKRELRGYINDRYDERIRRYKNGEKQWDLAISTVLAAQGVKPE